MSIFSDYTCMNVKKSMVQSGNNAQKSVHIKLFAKNKTRHFARGMRRDYFLANREIVSGYLIYKSNAMLGKRISKVYAFRNNRASKQLVDKVSYTFEVVGRYRLVGEDEVVVRIGNNNFDAVSGYINEQPAI